MALHLISFAFELDGKRRNDLLESLQSMGPAAQALASQWLLVSRRSAAEIFEELSRHVEARDCLIVAAVDPARLAAFNLPESLQRWLRAALGRLESGNHAPPLLQDITLPTEHGVSGVCRDFPE